jgi:hypothetical protein
VGSAAVIGDERACGAAGEQVDEHAEREREQPLHDPLGEAGKGLGEVILEAHLALVIGEDRLDDEPDACLCELGRRALTELVPVGGDELNLDELERVGVLAPHSPLSQNSRLPGSASR